MTIKQLEKHPLFLKVINDTITVQRQLYGDTPPTFETIKSKEPPLNEYQFYILGCGHSIGHLLSLCSQLDHLICYIDHYAVSSKMRRKGIDRYANLLYHIENYIIRIQSTSDRCLQVVNTIFHLCNARSQCNQRVILENIKVSRTNIPKVMKPLEQALSKYKLDRNTIIHRESYQDESLQKLEYFSRVIRPAATGTPYSRHFLPNIIKDIAKRIQKDKIAEFSILNSTILDCIASILNELDSHYIKMKDRLSKIL